MMMVPVMVLSVLLAVVAGFGRQQLTVAVAIDGILYAAARTSQRLNLMLLEEFDRTASHAAAQHYLRALLGDELWNLPRAVLGKIRILNHVAGGDSLALQIDHDEVRAAAEVVADSATQPTIIIC